MMANAGNPGYIIDIYVHVSEHKIYFIFYGGVRYLQYNIEMVKKALLFVFVITLYSTLVPIIS